MDLDTALYSKLAADGTLTALLGTYDGTPCIFSSRQVPPDAPRPYVHWSGNAGASPHDKMGGAQYGLDATRLIACVADFTGEPTQIESIAIALRGALHRKPLTITGYRHIMTICTNGPVDQPADDSLEARSLTFRIVANEE